MLDLVSAETKSDFEKFLRVNKMNFSVELRVDKYKVVFNFTNTLVQATVKRGRQSKKFHIGRDGTILPVDWREFDYIEDVELERENPLRYKVDCWINAVNEPFTDDDEPIINNENVLQTFVNAIMELFDPSGDTKDLEFLRSHPNLDEDMAYFHH